MQNISKFLKTNSDISYADFNRKFITSTHPILGVRIPALRKFAKEIEPEYIELNEKTSHEEIQLYIFSAAANYKTEVEQLEYLQSVLPYIDNWSTNDSITSLKKLTGEKSYQFFIQLLSDDREFYVRVGLIGLMRFFLKTDKVKEILENIRKITAQQYYVKMGIAWLTAELAITNFALAKQFISTTQDKFIRNKAISKARESFRITPAQKEELAKLKI